MFLAVARTAGVVLLVAHGAALATPQARSVLAQLPLHFEARPGADPAYVARGLDYQLRLTSGEAVFAIDGCGALDCAEQPAIVRARLDGARAGASATPEQPLPGRSHYLRGKDPARWARNVAHFGRVRYAGVYPGIDVVYYGKQGQLEYDFVVAPGADAGAIAFDLSGADGIRLDDAGDLVLQTARGDLRLRKPVAYQEGDGAPTEVAAKYRLERTPSRIRVTFQLGAYDHAQALVIDPVVDWSTLLGSSDHDSFSAIAVDGEGNAYITGASRGTDFPVTPGAFDETFAVAYWYDVVVSKISADGQTLLYSTYLGGGGNDGGSAIAVDAAGIAHVTGTAGTDFPVQNALQGYAGLSDAFLVKLSADGSSLLHSTYFGGAGSEGGAAIALDTTGNAYIGGSTSSADFPSARGFQNQIGGEYDAFVAKFDAATGHLVYATFLGGTDDDGLEAIAVDGAGRAYALGSTYSTDFPTQAPMQAANAGLKDVFVARLSANGRALMYSTYLGGSSYDYAAGIAVDRFGGAYITGSTGSASFPTVNSLQPFAGGPYTAGAGYDAFVARLRSDGSGLTFSTFLGGSSNDFAAAIALDAQRNVYVTGSTSDNDDGNHRHFPVVKPLQTFTGGATFAGTDAFVSKLRPDGSALLFSTPLGGAGGDVATGIAIDGAGRIHVAGHTVGGPFPTVDALQPRTTRVGRKEAFVTVIAQDADAVPDVLQFANSVFVVDENDGQVRIRVTRTGTGYGAASARILVAPGTATAGYDFAYDHGMVSWPHGQTGPRVFNLPIIHDAVHGEPVETVDFTLETTTGFVTLGTPTTARLRIREADDGTPQWVGVTLVLGNAIEDQGDAFALPFQVSVANERYNALEGATVALSIADTQYQKGTAQYEDADGDAGGTDFLWLPHYVVTPPVYPAFGCFDEDADDDGILDSGEDLNGNAVLDPGRPVTVPALLTTGPDGTAHGHIVYPKTHALWVQVDFTVAATGDYNGIPVQQKILLRPSAASWADSTTPPYASSPYGVDADCANPG